MDDIRKSDDITVTPDEAAVIMRENGIKIGTEAVRAGIEQGAFPFGVSFMLNKRVFIISKKKLYDWLEDFCGRKVVSEN